jgi:hypothetical protein
VKFEPIVVDFTSEDERERDAGSCDALDDDVVRHIGVYMYEVCGSRTGESMCWRKEERVREHETFQRPPPPINIPSTNFGTLFATSTYVRSESLTPMLHGSGVIVPFLAP